MLGQICSKLPLVLGKALYFHNSYSQFTWMIWLSHVTEREMFIILYADDKLLLAPLLAEFDNLFRICERELNLLDMAINFQKSACIRIGYRLEARCAKISSSTGSTIPWLKDKIPWRSYSLLQSRIFQCSLANHRKAFYRSANAVFGKTGSIASEEVVLQ